MMTQCDEPMAHLLTRLLTYLLTLLFTGEVLTEKDHRMTYTLEEYRALASHYVALARKQASSQMRWHYMGEARRNHIAANNIAYSARLNQSEGTAT
jgi:hypothetical protein